MSTDNQNSQQHIIHELREMFLTRKKTLHNFYSISTRLRLNLSTTKLSTRIIQSHYFKMCFSTLKLQLEIFQNL